MLDQVRFPAGDRTEAAFYDIAFEGAHVLNGPARNWLALVVAVNGFAIIGYVMINLHNTAKIMEVVWLAAGVTLLIYRMHAARRSEPRSA